MTNPRFIDIDGHRYAWADLVQRRKAQLKEHAKVDQPALFDDLKLDYRPPGERSATERYREPSLFANMKPT